MRVRSIAAVCSIALLSSMLVLAGPGASAAPTLSPAHPALSYEAGPYTNANVGGLLLDACDVPQGCDKFEMAVSIPKGYYESLRRRGIVGAVEITVSWPDNDDDFDVALLDSKGDPIATSGFGNSNFEKIVYTELPSGTYTIQTTVFRSANSGFHGDVRLVSMTGAATSATGGTGGLAFSSGTPVTLERSSGEPNMEISRLGDIYVDIPLGAGTNSILFKSTDNGRTFKPLSPLHPNDNPLVNNALGGGDSGLAIDPAGRMCFSELNTLLSLGIGCSADGGRSWTPADPLIVDPATPLVDRQWQAATPQGEQFISAQFGIVTVGPSAPGIRVFKEVSTTGQFVKVADVDTGEAMKSYNMAVDPSDTSEDGGTVVQAYLRSNKGRDASRNPHELMIWRSTDGGSTVNTYKVADLPTTPGNNFASVAVDRSGNMYVAWTEQGTWDVFYSVASKSNPSKWSKPVRVSADPARTAIQPTIKVGDRGRVFIGFYAAEQYGNPDKLDGLWNAYLAVSLNGACMLDARPCSRPVFSQARITDHPVQQRGICLGGTGCGGDPYYGDRSMLEYLDVEFTPATGQAHIVVTDSSRQAGDTTITLYHQIAGPSAYAGKPSIRAASGVVDAGAAVADLSNDAVWPYESAVAGTQLPGADIRSVRVTRANATTARVAIKMTDVSTAALDQALNASGASELLIGARFATAYDVLWAGMLYDGAAPRFAVGHLNNGFLVDVYEPDEGVTAVGRIDDAAKEIVVDVPLSAVKTEMAKPEGQARPRVSAVANGAPLYAVTAFAISSVTSIDDPFLAKRLLDAAPAFNVRRI